MFKSKYLLAALMAAVVINVPVMAKTVTLADLQDLPKATSPVIDPAKAYSNNHWAYKTLENITKKYGLAMGDPKEKLDGTKPLTRKDAAIILVNLVGKIEQDKIDMSEAEKAQVAILKQELKAEINELVGRVATLETTVDTLKGSVSNLEESNSHNFKYDFGKDFKIGGDLQAQYIGKIKKGDQDYPTNFGIPYTEIFVTGKPTPKTEYMVNISPTNFFDTTTNGILYDAFIASHHIPNHTVYLGQTQVPIGQEGPQSILTKETIDKSQFARLISDRYDLGLKVVGNYDFIDYYLGAYNGTGMNKRDSNRGLSLASWVNVKPLYKVPQYGKLELSGGYYNGKTNITDDDDVSQDKPEDVFGFAASYKYKKYGIRGEYSKLAAKLGETRTKSTGWYALNTYNLTPKLQLVAKYDRFDPDTYLRKNSAVEYTLGTNYSLTDNVMFRANYVLVDTQGSKNDQRFGIMTQYMF